jgi:hypothetical protein
MATDDKNRKRPCQICTILSEQLFHIEWKGPNKGFKKVCVMCALRYCFAVEIKASIVGRELQSDSPIPPTAKAAGILEAI